VNRGIAIDAPVDPSDVWLHQRRSYGLVNVPIRSLCVALVLQQPRRGHHGAPLPVW
jgi:hypothetical protein